MSAVSSPPDSPAAKGGPLLVAVSADKLTVTISGQAKPEASIAELGEQITGLLREKGVRHGTLAANIRQAIAEMQKGQVLEEVVIAQGTPPQPPRDAYIKTMVDMQNERVGRTTDSGHVDFRDKGPLPVVEPETTIASLSPAKPGQAGRDVFGELIPTTEPRKLVLSKGKGVELRENGLLAVAVASGIAHQPTEGKFEVLEVLQISGNVDFDSGHINFPGMVKISGAVLSDFKVKAKSMEVDELEPGSEVEVEHDLAVNGGVMGAKVKTGGNLTARLIRDSELVCKGDVTVEAEIHKTRIECGGKVTVTSGKGRIANSYVSAVKGVAAAIIKSSGKEATIIRLGLTAQGEQEMNALKQEIEALAVEKTKLRETIGAREQESEALGQRLKAVVAAAKDPKNRQHQAQLVGELKQLKEHRDGLRSEAAQDGQRQEEIAGQMQKLKDDLARSETMAPGGTVWLDVKGSAEANTQIRGPRASLTLQSEENNFSAAEMTSLDSRGKSKTYIHTQPLRKKAS